MRDLKAYKAMVHFLENRYHRMPSDALGGLLGELNLDLWTDGDPADPAVVPEWERALDKAEQELTACEPVFQKAS